MGKGATKKSEQAARVSVVMAVRNGAHHLSEAIESILAQTFGDYEFLIVDDASDDQTPDILDRFARREDRIQIIRNDQNIGPYPSANRALTIAKGDIIARIDADDRCTPDRLMRQVGFLDTHPEHLLVGSGYRSIDASGRVLFQKPNPMDDFAVRWTACFRMPMVHPSFSFRARLADGAPVKYREDGFAAQDYSLVADLLAVGKVACLAEPLVDYRMHVANISSTRRADQNRIAETVAKRVLAATSDEQNVDRFDRFFAALYRQEPCGSNDLAASAQAFRDLISEMDTQKQRSWTRRRAAGYLADAFVKPNNLASGVIQFVSNARDFCIPLALRTLEVKGVIKIDPTPGGDT